MAEETKVEEQETPPEEPAYPLTDEELKAWRESMKVKEKNTLTRAQRNGKLATDAFNSEFGRW